VKKLAAPLAATLAALALSAPAGAAVPQTKPDQTVVCDSAGHTAAVWFAKDRMALDATSCAGWVGYVVGDHDGASLIAVAPGAHFNRHGVQPGGEVRQITPSTACSEWWGSAVVVLPGHHGAFEAPDC
jgi:hypothetical protein